MMCEVCREKKEKCVYYIYILNLHKRTCNRNLRVKKKASTKKNLVSFRNRPSNAEETKVRRIMNYLSPRRRHRRLYCRVRRVELFSTYCS